MDKFFYLAYFIREKSEHGAPAEAQSVQKFQRLTLFQLWKHLNNIT